MEASLSLPRALDARIVFSEILLRRGGAKLGKGAAWTSAESFMTLRQSMQCAYAGKQILLEPVREAFPDHRVCVTGSLPA